MDMCLTGVPGHGSPPNVALAAMTEHVCLPLHCFVTTFM
jgi:hypothetical protein